MKLLWLCNMAPSAVEEKLSGKQGSGLWMDRMLEGLRQEPMEILLLCGGTGVQTGSLDGHCSYRIFRRGTPQDCQQELEFQFRDILRDFQPDLIHIWGTEFAHTLSMVRAAEALDLTDRIVINLQGVCSAIACHYTEGIPARVQKRYTFRDFLRKDNILQQKRKFALRGAHEAEALQKVSHVIGRTTWDRACAEQLHPGTHYHFCNETLREPFYQGQWRYEACRKHRIFASSCSYPVKGFHYLLEAFAQVLQVYPDAVLAVPGKSFLEKGGIRARLHRSSYQNYLADLARQYGLSDHMEFLGSLTAEQMKENYLAANVFVLPSTVENSPNSLGEAMLLGVPCAAAHVGGVDSLMERGEGFLYQSTASYMLAYYIGEIFAMEDRAEAMGLRARSHALRTHDPETNLRQLLEIYDDIAGKGNAL